MKILLINPPLVTTQNLWMSYGEPLGLAYVAAALEATGRHQVEVLDAMGLATRFATRGEYSVFGLTEDEILRRMRATRFDAIGITVVRMDSEAEQVTALCAMMSREFPGVPIIAGGPDVTLEWASYMKLGTIDYAILGEGEVPIVQLLDSLEGRGDLGDIKGICYRKDGAVKMVPPGPGGDITTLPWPARHLFPMDAYLRNKPTNRRTRAASILTSRACPFSCAFCSSVEIWGRKWRGRSAKDVVDEIEHLVKAYDVGEVHIFDDNFLVDRKRVEAIADGIIERGLKIALHIPAGLMMWLLSVELLGKLKRAGLISVQVQLESGNPETLEYIDKNIDISKAKDLVAAAHALRLAVKTNVILGFYFEDRAAIAESVRVAESIGFDKVDYILAMPKPRTRMHHDWVKAGLLGEDEPVVMPVDTLHFKGHELEALRADAQRLNTRHRLERLITPRTLFGYLIPKYVYEPGNALWLTQRVVRGGRQKVAQAVRSLRRRRGEAAGPATRG